MFSVIIPCYNVATYIEKCLDSVYCQEISEQMFEVIVVDDDSPDNVVEVAQEYLKEKNNYKIVSQPNKGLGGAGNLGIDNASGDYIIFLDADDWLLPHSFKTLARVINGEDIIEFSVSRSDDEREIEQILFPDSAVYPGVKYFSEISTINSACNKVYKRAFLNAYGLRFKEKIYGEDFEFNSRAYLYAKAMKSVSDKLAVFYQSPGSITRNVNKEKMLNFFSDMQFTANNIHMLRLTYASDSPEYSYLSTRLATGLVNTMLYALKRRLPSEVIIAGINSLRTNGAFDLGSQIKSRKLFRFVFSQKWLLNPMMRLYKLFY